MIGHWRDSKKDTALTVSVHSRPQLGFFDLPRELRDLVYSFHLPFVLRRKTVRLDKKFYGLNILLACQRVYDEASEILYKTRPFSFGIAPIDLIPDESLVHRLQHIQIEWFSSNQHWCGRSRESTPLANSEIILFTRLSLPQPGLRKRTCYMTITNDRCGCYPNFPRILEGMKYLRVFEVVAIDISVKCCRDNIAHEPSFPAWFIRELELLLGPQYQSQTGTCWLGVFYPARFVDDCGVQALETQIMKNEYNRSLAEFLSKIES